MLGTEGNTHVVEGMMLRHRDARGSQSKLLVLFPDHVRCCAGR